MSGTYTQWQKNEQMACRNSCCGVPGRPDKGDGETEDSNQNICFIYCAHIQHVRCEKKDGTSLQKDIGLNNSDVLMAQGLIN